jgi:hypothetical protein
MRLGALAAVVAGALRVASAFVPATEALGGLEWFYLVIDILLMFAVIAVYAYQHSESGVWGFVGFVLAAVGIESIGGPDGKIGTVDMYMAGASVIGIGMALLGVGSLVAQKLPRYVPVLWMLSTAVGVLAVFAQMSGLSFQIAGVLFGLGFVGAGVHILGDTALKR